MAIIAALLIALLVVLWFTVTSPRPSVPQRAAPTAQEVGAGRNAYWQLREARGNKVGKRVSLGTAELAGLGTVASHGFRPDRLRLSASGSEFRVEGSHRLPLGRWLNVTVRAQGPSEAFPTVRLTIGAWSLPPLLSQWLLEGGRWWLARRVKVPPLDHLVRNFSVRGGTVSATMSLPGKMGLVDQMAGAVARRIDSGEVIRVYCALAQRQKQQPSSDFGEQVRRAFSLDAGATPQQDFNRAAFVALGIFIVDERVADFAELSPSDLQRCRMPTVRTTIYDRADWPKHWALSAAIAVAAGVQLSEAAGEWKELADSLARRSHSAVGDPNGFSLSDLAADRAGFQTAHAAVQSGSAQGVASKLATVTPEQLLPRELVQPERLLGDAEFVARYGGVDDPRFKAEVGEIDAVLANKGVR